MRQSLDGSAAAFGSLCTFSYVYLKPRSELKPSSLPLHRVFLMSMWHKRSPLFRQSTLGSWKTSCGALPFCRSAPEATKQEPSTPVVASQPQPDTISDQPYLESGPQNNN